MKSLIDTTITGTDGKQHHLVVSRPHGAVNYQVLIDDYYVGQIVEYSTGWTACLNTGLLYSDDIGAIVDMVSLRPSS